MQTFSSLSCSFEMGESDPLKRSSAMFHVPGLSNGFPAECDRQIKSLLLGNSYVKVISGVNL